MESTLVKTRRDRTEHKQKEPLSSLLLLYRRETESAPTEKWSFQRTYSARLDIGGRKEKMERTRMSQMQPSRREGTKEHLRLPRWNDKEEEVELKSPEFAFGGSAEICPLLSLPLFVLSSKAFIWKGRAKKTHKCRLHNLHTWDGYCERERENYQPLRQSMNFAPNILE